MYHQRNAVERLLSQPTEKRCLSTRFEKPASSFKAMVILACMDCYWHTDFSKKA
ncbi:hypothetical protein CE139_20000 [Pseudomonas oryzihabitans]|uniref:Transposase n=1 Tax=Pseudomonas oryzihabitans TaxID=47885 RepID=A0A2Z5AAY0_9PSED|nr:hypothetical protein CE139_20000 [Pseudomonas oryzihabitans]